MRLMDIVVLFTLWLPLAYLQAPCNLNIQPAAPAVIYGGSVELNCTTSCTNYTKFDWEVPVEKKVQTGPGWSTLQISKLTQWQLKPVCILKRETEESIDSHTIIYVYQFEAPTFYLASEMVAYNLDRIVCNISRLLVRNSIPSTINITLSEGGNILNSSHGISSVEYSFVPKPQQDGKELLCAAYLHVGSEVVKKSARKNLTILAGPYNLQIISNRTEYRAGETIVLTCHAEGKPFPKFSWNLPTKDGVSYANRTIKIDSAQGSHKGTYQCQAANAYGSSLVHVDILVEENSRSWVIAAVMVPLVVVAGIAGFIIWKKFC